MKITAVLMVLAISSRLVAQPITLGNANMPGNNDTLRYTNIAVNSITNYQTTGTNHNWDFSNVTGTSEGVRRFKSAVNTPYFFYFLNSGEYGELLQSTLSLGPVTINDYYNFYRKQSGLTNAFVADGAGVTLSMVPVPAYYTDKDELYVFPMTYGQLDSTSFRFATPVVSDIPLRYSKTGTRATRVDGWGTVKTPYGTENCLRLVTTQYSMDTVIVTVLGQTIPFGLPNNVRSYQWMTLNSKIPYLEVTGNLLPTGFTVTQARFRGYDHTKVPVSLPQEDLSGMVLYPHPVKDQFYLRAKSSCIMNVLTTEGRLVRTETLSTGDNLVSVSELPGGLYVAEMKGSGAPSYIKFIKLD